MILAALYEYYQRVAGSGENAPPPPGFVVQKVTGAIQLDADGRFLGILPLLVPADKGKDRPRPMVVPDVGPRPGKQIKPAFVCDTAAFLLGYDPDDPERASAKFAAAAAFHQNLLAKTKTAVAVAVLRYFESWNVGSVDFSTVEPFLSGFLVFIVDGSFVHEHPVVQAAWQRHAAASTSTTLGQCLVTGADSVPIARLHPAIKGAGGQPGGTLLVSFNFDAAESYGHVQSFNAPVSETAAFGYAAALNHLLRRETNRARTIGDMTVVVWAERPCAGESLLMSLFDPVGLGADEDSPPEDRARAAQVRDALDCIMRGEMPADLKADEGVKFYLLGVSPNAARLSVRLWQVSTLGELIDNVRQHQRDLMLVTDSPKRAPYPALWTLVNETRPKDGDGRSRGRPDNDKRYKLHGDLLRAALGGGRYPAALLPELLCRFAEAAPRWLSRMVRLRSVPCATVCNRSKAANRRPSR